MNNKTQSHEPQKPIRDLRVLRGESTRILEQLQKVRSNT